jgi:Fe-S oxidoreductase
MKHLLYNVFLLLFIPQDRRIFTRQCAEFLRHYMYSIAQPTQNVIRRLSGLQLKGMPFNDYYCHFR